MPALKILSWNIQNLGQNSIYVPKQDVISLLVDVIAEAIYFSGADIVGIMEIQSGLAEALGRYLAEKLNAKRATKDAFLWSFRASSRQEARPNEQYLMLWKDQANVLTLNDAVIPGPTTLLSVVDDNSLENILKKMDPDKQGKLLKRLEEQGYIYFPRFGKQRKSQKYRVCPEKWMQLKSNKQIPLGPPFSDQDGLNAGNALYYIDMLSFTRTGDRSPFVACFKFYSRTITVALLHSPAPNDPIRTDVLNILSMSELIRREKDTFLMGDFNIDFQEQQKLTGRCYERTKEGMKEVIPRTFLPAFKALTSAGFIDLNPRERTTLAPWFFQPNATMDQLLSSEYDRFLRAGDSFGTAAIDNLIAKMAKKEKNFFKAGLASLATKYFQSRYSLAKASTSLEKKRTATEEELVREEKKLQFQNQQLDSAKKQGATNISQLEKRVDELEEAVSELQEKLQDLETSLLVIAYIDTIICTPLPNVPDSLGTAHTIYRLAISDHMPIQAAVQFD